MINAMRDSGLDPGAHLIADGKLHRFDVPGDRAKSGNGWYVLYDGDIQAGRFGSWKTGQSEKWCSKTAHEFTPEEKTAYKAKMESARREREREQQKLYEECRTWCKQAWSQAQPISGDNPYLLSKKVHSYGLKQFKDSLMVPVKGLDGVLHGVQFIYPDGKKKFKVGTDKKAHFHLIGKPVDNTMIVCEGYATGASIHEATGHAVLVAFDAGNIKPVAEFVHHARPALKLVIAADNDQWTEGNPGVTKGTEAARSVKGECRVPKFANIEGKPTDFNDLFNLEGQAAVMRQIFPPPMAEYGPPPIDDDYEPAPLDPDEFTEHPLQSAPFQCLGYNHGEYFYLPKGAPQVKSLTADRHSSSHLVSMAPLQWWEGTFPNKTGFDASAAANMLYRTNEKIGVYDNRRIRGRGAWIEEPKDRPKRTVLHLGESLVVDGKKVNLSEHRSHWIYEAGGLLELDGLKTEPMLNTDSHKLLELCKRFTWEKPLFAELLAGWMVIAPLCGVMPWRPHILVTGPAGSGKSTISDNVVRPAVGPSAICCMGNTTEAGLRGEAGSDARPVLFDEAESGGEASKRMQAVLELARQSSSDIGYSILKGSQSGKSVKYQPRMCFCFSSIGAAATQQADNERITALSLRKDEQTGHVERYEETKRLISALLVPSYCQALRSRGYSLIPVILDNYRTFSRLLAVRFSSQRTGDQYGALLAGSYSLRSRNTIDDATAEAFINSLDWGDSIQDSTSRDEVQCLGVILQHQIQVAPAEKKTVGELLETSVSFTNTHWEAARATLLRNGIRVTEQGDGFYLANKHTAIEAILQKTPWSQNWGHILARVHGAIKTKPMNFTAGAYSRSVLLPMTVLSTGGE
jgi:putative DNA primase/helicase